MFGDQNVSYASSQSSGADTGSFSSFSSFSDEQSYTPSSSRRESFQSNNLVDSPYINDGCTLDISMATMPNDAFVGMSNMMWSLDGGKPSADFQNFNLDSCSNMPYQCNPYQDMAFNITPMVPPLVTDLNSPLSEFGSSQISDLGSSQDDFINPSETFLDVYNAHSPCTMAKIDSSSPMSAYTMTGSSPARSTYMSYQDDMRSCSTTPSRSSPLRQAICRPLEASAALHRVQAADALGLQLDRRGNAQLQIHQQQIKLERSSRKRITRESAGLPVPGLRVESRAMKKCQFKGCNGKFKRQEHLKRHERTHTGKDIFPCEFCPKTFNRSDNLKSHVKLHTDPDKKSSRTPYVPGARELYDQMSRKPRKNQESESPTIKQDPDAPTTRSRGMGY
jgi:uncharacterized Zn-finger protein